MTSLTANSNPPWTFFLTPNIYNSSSAYPAQVPHRATSATHPPLNANKLHGTHGVAGLGVVLVFSWCFSFSLGNHARPAISYALLLLLLLYATSPPPPLTLGFAVLYDEIKSHVVLYVCMYVCSYVAFISFYFTLCRCRHCQIRIFFFCLRRMYRQV